MCAASWFVLAPTRPLCRRVGQYDRLSRGSAHCRSHWGHGMYAWLHFAVVYGECLSLAWWVVEPHPQSHLRQRFQIQTASTVHCDEMMSAAREGPCDKPNHWDGNGARSNGTCAKLWGRLKRRTSQQKSQPIGWASRPRVWTPSWQAGPMTAARQCPRALSPADADALWGTRSSLLFSSRALQLYWSINVQVYIMMFLLRELAVACGERYWDTRWEWHLKEKTN